MINRSQKSTTGHINLAVRIAIRLIFVVKPVCPSHLIFRALERWEPVVSYLDGYYTTVNGITEGKKLEC